MALPDNVKSIAGRGPGTRRPRPNPPPPTKSTAFDSLLSLAIELEQRTPQTPTRHLSPAPDPDMLQAPPEMADAVASRSRPGTGDSTVTLTRPSRSTENFLIVVACILVALIAALLVWGDQLERLLRPDLESSDRLVEESVLTGPSSGGNQSPFDPLAPPDDAPTSSSPSTTQAPPPASDATASDPSVAAAGVAPFAVACDAASVWPLVAPLNDIGPVKVAWVTCLDSYATAGLVPADSPPETPATFVATLRAEGASWTLLSGGEPAACAPAATAADPAFPPALCG